MSASAPQAANARAPRTHHLASMPTLAVIAPIHFDGDPDPGDDPGLLAWVNDHALPSGDPIHAAVIVGSPEPAWKRPRGLSWSDYPVTMDKAVRLDLSRWRNARVHYGWAGDVQRAHLVDAAAAVRASKAIAILLTGSVYSSMDEGFEARTLADMHRVFLAVGAPAENVVVVVRIGRQPDITTVADLPSLCADELVRDRFLFSYGVSASVIHGRLLADVLEGTLGGPFGTMGVPSDVRCLPNDDLTMAMAVNSARQGNISDLGSPIGLQVLFRLRSFGMTGCPARPRIRPSAPDPYEGADLSALGGGSDEDGHPLWVGTGRHEPIRLTENMVDLAVKAARRFRLAEVVPGIGGAPTGLALTESGLAFLDRLHPDNEDADLVLRWARPGTPNAKAMDSWIVRNFAKAKFRMSNSD
jgi:hypothetical protein